MSSSGHQRLLVLVGSPRRSGNSATLAVAVERGARAAGGTVDVRFVADHVERFLGDCRTCRGPDGECTLDDGFRRLFLDDFLPADGVVFCSPVAARVIAGSDGVIRGKDALRDYWAHALGLVPDLRFELVGVYTGIDSIVINYRNQRGGLVNEVLVFNDDGLVSEGHGTYAADDRPAGIPATTG